MNSKNSGYIGKSLITWRKWTDIPLIVLAVGSLPILLLELVSNRLSNSDQQFIQIVNVVVFVAFFVDYLVELAIARQKSSYIRHEWTSLLVVVAQGLAISSSLGLFGALRSLRALRLFVAIGRLVAIGSAAGKETRRIFARRAASLAIGVAGFTWITSAVGFTLAEDVGVNGRVKSFGDALWWSASTISTVGYGDIYPVSAAGRTLAVFTMMIGVSVFGVLTARIAQFLIQNNSKTQT